MCLQLVSRFVCAGFVRKIFELLSSHIRTDRWSVTCTAVSAASPNETLPQAQSHKQVNQCRCCAQQTDGHAHRPACSPQTCTRILTFAFCCRPQMDVTCCSDMHVFDWERKFVSSTCILPPDSVMLFILCFSALDFLLLFFCVCSCSSLSALLCSFHLPTWQKSCLCVFHLPPSVVGPPPPRLSALMYIRSCAERDSVWLQP